jgi:hypothetical protein
VNAISSGDEPFDGIMSGFVVRNHPTIPVPMNYVPAPAIDYDFSLTANIMAVGVGSFGASIAKTLAATIEGVACSEVFPSPRTESPEDMNSLLSAVQKSDVLFLLARFDSEDCSAIARTIGQAACGAGVPTFLITPHVIDEQFLHELTEDGVGKWFDTVFSACDKALPILPDPTPWENVPPAEYLMCHLVTVITSVLTHRSGIGTAFDEFVDLLKSGRFGFVGIGIASGMDRGRAATLDAIDHLIDQGVDFSEKNSLFRCVYGSTHPSYDDLDDMNMTIAEKIDIQLDDICGVIQDEQFWCDIEVIIIVTLSK